MREIDGSYGEGGGQLLRTSVALAAITGQPVHVYNIRAKRANPGLAPQHLTAVKAVAALCGAEAEGLEVKSREISFWPGPLRGGQFDFPVGTAGSITLVLQAALPVAVACGEKLRMNITGGTDVRAAPPLDYLRHVLLPLLYGMGVRAKIDLLGRGYYPRGGGRVTVEVEPSPPLRPLVLDVSGPLTEIRGYAHISDLPAHIVQRMTDTALAELSIFPPPAIDLADASLDKAFGAGAAIVLVAHTEHTRLGASGIAQRGIPAEQLGTMAGQFLRGEILSGATLDIHAADQILIYLALASGSSCFLARNLSSHAATTIWLLEQFLPVHFDIRQERRLIRVKAEPTG
ncbi:RNA 3'-terminal phosphate cyclase (ATP)/RNA 3'-terminal phosphate cyclase (GTP) [Nitrosospira sp. Nl5]|uniref:RNA 3'-terminal phosphate cyclase n=1 Tax=Nitrosospira sp. Nl5 TaxID=200120 RepID=UPI0008801DDF|nr:RNA 3'-terminal phosphate cyclase [Nitrosospira sp. Nl5]SCY31165.1 RNA 3'-terminal phosphate cyclase (ATP)/RNA 3'-terminal phosphate cyclase (GTP) [Nitrosospira sp. Nl5]